MKEGSNATAPGVIIINASLGDRNKPFAGHMSGWVRVLDYLAYRYGILFVVSAGNQFADLGDFPRWDGGVRSACSAQKARTALRASGQTIASRRILAHCRESINAPQSAACTGISIRSDPLPLQPSMFGLILGSAMSQALWGRATGCHKARHRGRRRTAPCPSRSGWKRSSASSDANRRAVVGWHSRCRTAQSAKRR